MGLSILELMILQYVGYLINGIGILYTVHVLWQKKIRLTKFLLSFLIFYTLFSTIVVIMSLPYIETGTDAKIEILFEVFMFSALVIYYMYLFKSNNVKKILPSIMINSALENIFNTSNSICTPTFFASSIFTSNKPFNSILAICET